MLPVNLDLVLERRRCIINTVIANLKKSQPRFS